MPAASAGPVPAAYLGLLAREWEATMRHIARAFKVSTWTAWKWAQRGAELWQQEGSPEGLEAALAALPPLDDLQGPDGSPGRPHGASGGVQAHAGARAAAARHRRGVRRVG